MAIGQPFFLNGISKLACIWFGDNERAIAIGILAFAFALGSIVGLVLGTFFVLDEHKDNHELIRKESIEFMRVVSWGTTFLCAPMILLYKQRPKMYPSNSAYEDATQVKSSENSICNEL